MDNSAPKSQTDVTDSLTALQKDLLDTLQEGIEICRRPYEKLAGQLHSTEAVILKEIERLKKEGFIRRFRGRINYRAFGRVATLVTASVPEEKLDSVVSAVNALSGVSHNYLRSHEFNVWFTLQGESFEQIDSILADLSKQQKVEFHSLPARRLFKLDVRFGVGRRQETARKIPDFAEGGEPVVLTDEEKQALSFLQKEFPLEPAPFAKAERLDETSCLEAVRSLANKGVLLRIAAVANHYKLGYRANGMFCMQVPAEQAELVGSTLAGYKQISHCYERRTFAGWPYNVFAMVHVHTDRLLETWVEDFAHTMKIENYALLKSVRELKKEPVVLDFS